MRNDLWLTPTSIITEQQAAAAGITPEDPRFAMALSRASKTGKWHRTVGGCLDQNRYHHRDASAPATPAPAPTHSAIGFTWSTMCRNCGNPLPRATQHALGAMEAVAAINDWETTWQIAQDTPVTWLDHAILLASVPPVGDPGIDLAAPLRQDPQWADVVDLIDRARPQAHQRVENLLAVYAAAAPTARDDAAIAAAIEQVAPTTPEADRRIAEIAYGGYGSQPGLWPTVSGAWAGYRRHDGDTSPAGTAAVVADVLTKTEDRIPSNTAVRDLTELPATEPAGPESTPRDGETVHQWAARIFTTYRTKTITTWVEHLDEALDGLRSAASEDLEPLTDLVVIENWPPIEPGDDQRAHLSRYPVIAAVTLQSRYASTRSSRWDRRLPTRYATAPEQVAVLAVPAWQANALTTTHRTTLPAALPADTALCHPTDSAAHADANAAAADLLHAAGFRLTRADTPALNAVTTIAPQTAEDRTNQAAITEDWRRPLRHGATPPKDWSKGWSALSASFVLLNSVGARFVVGHDNHALLALALTQEADLPAEITMAFGADPDLIAVGACLVALDLDRGTLTVRPFGQADQVRVPLGAISTITIVREDSHRY